MASGVDRRQRAVSRQPGRSDEGEGLQLSFIQVIASALAAASGAIVTSAFGVAGTIVGAAVMSLIATSATAVYSHSIKRTSRMIRQPFHPHSVQPSRAATGYGAAGYGAPGYGAVGYSGAGYGHYGGAAGAESYASPADAGYGAPAGAGYGPTAGEGYGEPAAVYGRSANAEYGRAASSEPAKSAAAGDPAPMGDPRDQASVLGADSRQAAERGASDQASADAARPGYTEPRTYGKGRRLNRKVGLALGIVLTFVIALATLTVIELLTGQSSAGLWGQGGNSPSIIGGGDTSAPSRNPASPASSPTYTGSPTPSPTSTSSPTSTATPSATSSHTATSTPSRTSSPTATGSAQLRAPSPSARVQAPSASP